MIFLTQGTCLNLLSANTFVSNRIHDAKIQFCAKKAWDFMPHISSNYLMLLALFSFPSGLQ